jgi:hypothetical protein
MRTVSSCASALVTAAITASASGAYAQDTKLSVPNVTITAPAAPVAPPYMRDPWKVYSRNPYFGRYRVEEEKFVEAPCTQTRIGVGPSGKCLQGYRLTVGGGRSSSACIMALDVVIDSVGKLSIEADVLIFDPNMVTTTASNHCYVRDYTGYDQEGFQDMNQVTRRGSNWRNLQINDMQDQWYGGERSRSIEFSDGPRNCIAVRKPGPRWRGGCVYMMHASICGTDTAAVQAQDVAYVLGSLQTRIYDPVGNLRKADDQTTFGPATNSR